MISKEAATEASRAKVSYVRISGGHLITGIVDSTQYDFMIYKYIYWWVDSQTNYKNEKVGEIKDNEN